MGSHDKDKMKTKKRFAILILGLLVLAAILVPLGIHIQRDLHEKLDYIILMTDDNEKDIEKRKGEEIGPRVLQPKPGFVGEFDNSVGTGDEEPSSGFGTEKPEPSIPQ